MSVVFCEKLHLMELINYELRGQRVFYGSLSLFARLGLKFAASRGFCSKINEIELGDVHSIPGVRRNAYKNAEKCVDSSAVKNGPTCFQRSGFDFWLLVQKYFFDKFYQNFQFIELVLKFAEENPDQIRVIFVSSDNVINLYGAKLRRVFAIKYRKSLTLSKFFASILLLPLLALLLSLIKRTKFDLKINNKIICEVEDTATHEMFRSLFHDVSDHQLLFVADKWRIADIEDAKNILTLGLDAKGQRVVIKSSLLFCLRSLCHLKQVWRFGGDIFYIFYHYVCGKAATINGQKNIYCTFEHLVTFKAVRNELLRSTGNRAYMCQETPMSPISSGILSLCSTMILCYQQEGILKISTLASAQELKFICQPVPI